MATFYHTTKKNSHLSKLNVSGKDERNSASASYSKDKSATSEITVKCDEPGNMCSSDEAMALMQGNCSQGNGNENNSISRSNQASANKPEIENPEGGNSASVRAELQGSSNPNAFFVKSDDSLPDAQPNLDDHNQQEQLPPDDDSEQGEPCDDHRESNESDDPPGANPRFDFSSDQSYTSSASNSHSARDGKLCA